MQDTATAPNLDSTEQLHNLRETLMRGAAVGGGGAESAAFGVGMDQQPQWGGAPGKGDFCSVTVLDSLSPDLRLFRVLCFPLKNQSFFSPPKLSRSETLALSCTLDCTRSVILSLTHIHTHASRYNARHASSPLYWRTSCRWGRGIWWDAGDADGWLWWNARYANGWLWCNTGNANGWRWNARDANGWQWNAWNANGWHDARALYDRDGGDGRHAWRHAHCGRRAYVRQRTACSLPRYDIYYNITCIYMFICKCICSCICTCIHV